MLSLRFLQPAIGLVLIATTLAAIAREWVGGPVAGGAAAICVATFLVLAAPGARWSRQAFVGVGLLLSGVALATRPGGAGLILSALETGAFIAGFFVALASLRNPASRSPAIEQCGQYLASQPPGKRYLALTAGGHLFALILSYGAISLLVGLTEAIANREKNVEVREIRNRRMLLAIQRGFCATLAWSPLAFAMAISTSLVPGASWAQTAPLAMVNAFLIAFIGWALDTIFKPSLSGPRPPRAPEEGDWRDLRPLAILLAILFVGVGVLEVLSGLRVIAVVLLFVPILSIGWILLQSTGRDRVETDRGREGPGDRFAGFAFGDVVSYRGELVLLVMAGFIGSLGADLAVPLLGGMTERLADAPGWLLAPALVWIVPLLGQLGMNPILGVSILAPLIPAPDALGLSPAVIVAALTAGWALAGASAPFTATTLLIGRLGHTTAFRVGTGWNRGFMAACLLVLSVSIGLAASLLPA